MPCSHCEHIVRLFPCPTPLDCEQRCHPCRAVHSMPTKPRNSPARDSSLPCEDGMPVEAASVLRLIRAFLATGSSGMGQPSAADTLSVERAGVLLWDLSADADAAPGMSLCSSMQYTCDTGCQHTRAHFLWCALASRAPSDGAPPSRPKPPNLCLSHPQTRLAVTNCRLG